MTLSKRDDHQHSTFPQRATIKLDKLFGKNFTWTKTALFKARRPFNKPRELEILTLNAAFHTSLFLKMYSDTLLFNFNRPSFSLRSPVSIGKTFKPIQIEDPKFLLSPESASRHKSLSTSFFAYKPYTYIGQFFESKRWLRLEEKWELMLHLDIKNCFKSIYTHSITWAVFSKSLSKQNIKSIKDNCFGQFDSLIQASQFGETHGIPIGPESSRIFAETILQGLDREILLTISSKGIKRSDYEILRYLDDYFVFANTSTALNQIKEAIDDVFSVYRLSVNESKITLKEQPFSKEVTARKYSLRRFIRSILHEISPFSSNGKVQLPFLEPREINIHLKEVLLVEDASSPSLTSSVIGEIDRSISKLFERLVNDTVKNKLQISDNMLTEVIQYIWIFINSCASQLAQRPSISSLHKVIRIVRNLSIFINLMEQSNGSNTTSFPKTKHLQRNFIQYLVHNHISSLLRKQHTEVEICYWLALSISEGIFDDSIVGLIDKALVKLSLESLTPDSSFESVFFVLSSLSYLQRFDSSSSLNQNANNTVLNEAKRKLSDICKTIFKDEFSFNKSIKVHAIQEIVFLAILQNKMLSMDEKVTFLNFPWVEGVLNRTLIDTRLSFPNKLRNLVNEIPEVELGDTIASRKNEYFLWSCENYDEVLLSKLASFVY